MSTQIAFLRAINVAGRYIKMAALAGHLHTLGYPDAITYINSGNLIFSAKTHAPSQLEASIEEGLAKLLGFRSEVFMRSEQEVEAIAKQANSLRQQMPEGGEVNVAFLREPLSQAQLDQLLLLRSELDDFVSEGRQVYWLCLGKQSDSKFSNAVLERKLRLRTTFRRSSMLQGLVETLKA